MVAILTSAWIAFGPTAVLAERFQVDRTTPATELDPCASKTGETPGSYEAFLGALRQFESSGNYRAVNTLNFIGAYQFGEAALIDLGYVLHDDDAYDNDFSGGFTGKNGIHSVDDFLENPAVQDQAAQEWMQLMWRYIEVYDLDRHAWREMGDVTLSPSGMLAATHLLGPGALREFVELDGTADLRDLYGMPLRTYIVDLGGYSIPFVPNEPISNSLSKGSPSC